MVIATIVLAAASEAVFRAPFIAMAKGQPIKLEVGHAAPYLADFNRDGLPDLIVGQFHEGKARIYLNKGAKGEPKFTEFTWMKAGGETATVPYG